MSNKMKRTITLVLAIILLGSMLIPVIVNFI